MGKWSVGLSYTSSREMHTFSATSWLFVKLAMSASPFECLSESSEDLLCSSTNLRLNYLIDQPGAPGEAAASPGSRAAAAGRIFKVCEKRSG